MLAHSEQIAEYLGDPGGGLVEGDKCCRRRCRVRLRGKLVSMQESAAFGLLGRTDAWGRVGVLLERAAGGVGGVVLVAGEAGLGKTALCDALCSAASQDGWTVSWAAATPASTVPGLWPWRRLLSSLDGRELPGAEVGRGDPDAARVAQFDSIVERIGEVAAGSPVLAVIDDVHWADPATLAMVVHFAAASRPLRACLIVTYRPEDAGPDTPMGEVLPWLRSLAIELPLSPLGRGDVAVLAADVAGGVGIDGELLDALVNATGGNPLFVSEVVRQFGGRIPSAVDRLAGPPSPAVAAIVAARVARLSALCREVLAVGSAIGRTINVGILSRVLAVDAGKVLAGLGEAVDAAVIGERDDGEFEFRHPVFHSAIYDGLGTAGRASVHARIATALEAALSDGVAVELAALAHHFGRSAPLGNAAKAARYAVAAGDEAMLALAYETASRRYTQALAMLDLDPDAGDRVAVLLARGDADAATGRHADATQAYEAAARLAAAADRVEELARAALGRTGGSGMEIAGDDESREVLERALAGVGDDRPAVRARLLARLSIVIAASAPTAERERLVQEANVLASVADDPLAKADVAVARCHVQAGPAGIGSRLDDAATIVSEAMATRQVRLELLGRRLRVEALLEAGRVGDARDEIGAYEARAALVRDPSYDFFIPLWRAALAMAAGDDAGYRRAREALDGVLVRLPTDSNGRVLAAVQVLFREIDRGEAAGAQAVFDTLAGSMRAGLPPQVAISEALIHALAGRADDARTELAQWAHRIREMTMDAEWLPAVVQLADIASLAGNHVLVEWAREQLEPHAAVWSVEGIGAAIRGPAARALAELATAAGDGAAADRWRARTDHLVLDAGLPVARDAVAPGARLIREGDAWVVTFGARVARVRDSKGMRDIAELVVRPGKAIAALDLAGAGQPTVVQASTGERLDATARAQYRQRLAELESELDDADRAGDIARSERLTLEHDLLAAELAGAYGLGGRPRRAGSSAERARTAVTTRVKDALRRLDAVHPAAANHLRRAVRTGTFCTYDPDPPMVWEVVRPGS